MKPRLKLNFADFWQPFNPTDNFFYNLLSERYEIELTDRPDYLICSLFGASHRQYDCVRILYVGENTRPDLTQFDYSFSFDHTDDPRNYRLPLYALHPQLAQLLLPKPPFEQVLAEKTGFCNMVVSNPWAEDRIRFFHKLSRHRRVDSGGSVLNNIGGPVPWRPDGNPGKLDFIRRYKFTLAFENSSHPGYTTEKIVEPMFVHSVPVYWGNPLVARDFNPASFVNVHDFADEDAAVEHIIALDSDPELHRRLHAEPYFHQNRLNPYADRENIHAHFRRIFDAGPHARPRG
jgi:alpha(1,3/1,4) fucosyltransferase